MVMTTGSIPKALLEGVKLFYGLGYKQLEEQFSKVFDVQMSDREFEEHVNVNPFGMARLKTQGADLSYEDISQGFLKRYVHAVYALGYTITEENYDDGKYPELVRQYSQSLGNSMRFTKETICANILNRAFNSNYVGADGIELGSSLHKWSKGGTYGNELATPADLSELAAEQAIVMIQDFRDDAGNRIGAQAQSIIIPIQLQHEAARIFGNQMQYNTAENNINAMSKNGDLPGGIIRMNYLTNPKAWFMKTSVPNGLMFYQRKAVQLNDDTDFNSKNYRYSAHERYCAGWTDPRGLFCVEGSA